LVVVVVVVCSAIFLSFKKIFKIMLRAANRS